MDQVYGFRVAIHLLEPPLTEMPERSQAHEQSAPAAAPNGARATRHCAGLRAKPKARQKLEWMAGILLRLWLNDGPAQNKRIDVLLAAHGGMPDSLLVTDVVLAEAGWTLKSAFEQDRSAQSIAVRSLLEETAFAFEDRQAVSAALSLFESGSCGFADCLAVATPARQGCDFTATFDRGMRKLPTVKVPDRTRPSVRR